jgi:hypothetical protein
MNTPITSRQTSGPKPRSLHEVLACPWCKSKITQMADSRFYTCIQGAPSGDPRGWGCGWWGEPGNPVTPFGDRQANHERIMKTEKTTPKRKTPNTAKPPHSLGAAHCSPSSRQTDEGVRCQYFEAAPNRMFSELTRACVRYVRYEEKVPCALCGKQSKKHWTCVVRFKAASLNDSMFIVKLSKNWFKARQPVCCDHPTQPDEKLFLRMVKDAQKKVNDKIQP